MLKEKQAISATKLCFETDQIFGLNKALLGFIWI